MSNQSNHRKILVERLDGYQTTHDIWWLYIQSTGNLTRRIIELETGELLYERGYGYSDEAIRVIYDGTALTQVNKRLPRVLPRMPERIHSAPQRL